MSDSFELVLHFVKNQIGKHNFFLTKETTIENDLRITGDDADEFMIEFFKEFQIDVKDYDFRNHFEVEGFALFNLAKLIGLKTYHSNKETIPITLGHLEKVVKMKKWELPE